MVDDIRGVGFPFRIDPKTGGVAWSIGSEKIRHNVSVILGTRPGERPMLREFGARIHALLQEVNDAALAQLLVDQSRQALLQWEPRVLVTRTSVDQSEGELRLKLEYVHTNEPIMNEMIVPLR
jgi:uncharacterized protein